MPSIQERRHRELVNRLAQLQAQREDAIGRLIKLDAKVCHVRRQVARYEKRLAALAASPPVRPLPAAAVTVPAPVAPVLTPPAADDDDSIPDFLRRKRAGEAKDAAAAEQLRAELAEQKKRKARGRVARMLAAKAGATSTMPLTGNAALAAIRGS